MSDKFSRPVYVCRRTSSPVVVDGLLSEQCWNEAYPADLKLHDGSGNPQFGVIARACYDDSNLYVSFECQDTEIQATFDKRDDPIYDEEVVEVFIDPDSDELTYYEFEFSPRNVVFDAMVENPSGVEGVICTSLDCPGLQSAVTPLVVDSDGKGVWTAEIAIPFASLAGGPNTPPKPGDRWLANFYRINRIPVLEFTCFSPTLAERPNYHIPARFGVLEFV